MSTSELPEVHSEGSDDSDEAEQYKGAAPKAKTVRSSRACITCRRMKTRCEIDEALGSACKLCIRTRRQCIMQDIPRRRKRKTTERVADLEEKINILTALLASKDAGASTTDTDSVPNRPDPDQESSVTPEESLIAEALSRGLFDWETACAAFERYQHEMSHYFPFVVFPKTTNAKILREQQPLLLFAIITVSISKIRSKVDSELCDMLVKDLALRIVYKGERSLELVQTLLVHVCFYSRALQMRDLNFNQMTHIASTMATDIGLGRRPHRATSEPRNGPYQLESLAARRAWLGCYYMATSISMALRHPAFVRWSVYTEQCLDIISVEPPALPSDVWLCDLIRIQRIAEAGSLAFSMDDPGASVTLRDIRIQYQLRGFRQQLDYWRRHARTDLSLPYVRHVAASTDLFINEIALHPEHDIDDLRSPLRIPQTKGLDELALKFKDLHFIPAREEALFACLAAIHECFDALLSTDIATASTLPNLFFVRTGYAARALRKLLNICDSQAEYEGRSHIDVRDLKFEEYLNSIIALLAKVHSENNSTVARAFGLVLAQIKAQALESSKLLSAVRLPGDSSGIDPKLDPDSTFSIGTKGPCDDPCYQLLGSAAVSRPDFATGTPFAAPPTLPIQPPPVAGPLHPQAQVHPTPWQENDADDEFMTGIDVLQWFEQDFALTSGAFDYDGMGLQPADGHWQY
ncbi:hypothetical protein A1O7_02486 [Cladophialophora yegresii CBS 114405]|uniref:Zn(2)-C6 fungal-type domain-containing protein n=1 Tax=Cladophialophora yegresii CBS 114405 TaxID=1182544 RepID=W9W280_9EURO|nr:uncharacterized protein A1O7_02486 [Cladophialophora yegresii CBS 114405]EXJ62053.1 hypothetical protein A1O7_02486 [Cladophialophora yegresii CBS 114405]